MSISNALLLGLIQGITEFLPISSSGHLILAERFLGLPVETLKSFDVALHAGTLIAIVIYFRKDFWEMGRAFFSILGVIKKTSADVETLHPASLRLGRTGCNTSTKYRTLIFYLIIATIPAVIIGGLFNDWIDAHFRFPNQVARHMLMAGLFFIMAETIYKKYYQLKQLGPVNGWRQALLVGLAQTIALFPGFSRSGWTMAAGILQGVKRDEAARFSFLLGAIAIFGAVVLTIIKVIKQTESIVPLAPLLVGFFTSLIAGYLSIAFLIKFLKNHSLKIFAGYLLIVGIMVLIYSSTGSLIL